VTLKSFFKNKDAKEQDIIRLQQQIKVRGVEIESFKRLIEFITLY